MDRDLELLLESAAGREEVELLREQEQELSRTYIEFSEMADNYIGILQSEEELDIAESDELGRQADTIGTRLRDFSDAVAQLSQGQVEEMRNTALALGRILTTLTVIGIVVGLLVAAYVVRGLLGQLGGDPDEVAAIARRVAKGDLTVTTEREGKKRQERGLLAAMLEMQSSLIGIISEVNASVRETGQYNRDLATASSDKTRDLYNQVDENATRTIDSLTEISHTMSELSHGADEINDAVRVLNETSNELKEGSADIKEGIGMIRDSVGSIKEVTQEVVQAVHEIGAGSTEINEPMNSLNDSTSAMSDAMQSIQAEMRQFRVRDEADLEVEGSAALGDDGQLSYGEAYEKVD